MTPPIGSARAGIVSQVEDAIPDSEALHARYDFSRYSGTSGFSDLTGNGYDLVNGSITGVGESINGVQAGEFDGTDDGVVTNTFSDIYPFTVSTVVRVDNLNSTNDTIGQFSTDNMLFRHNDAFGWELNAATDLETSSSATGVLLGTVIFADSGAVIRFNGSELASGSTGTGRDANEIAIGYFPENTQGFLNGAVGEMLVYPDIRSPSQIDDIEAYLADKWGIAL